MSRPLRNLREADVAGLDVLDGRMIEFDWSAVFAGLGEAEDVAAGRDIAAQAVRRIILWLVAEHRHMRNDARKRFDAVVGRRVIALAWSLDPSLLAESPTLARLARRLGCERATLSKVSRKAQRDFRLTPRAGSRGRKRVYDKPK